MSCRNHGVAEHGNDNGGTYVVLCPNISLHDTIIRMVDKLAVMRTQHSRF